MILVSAAEFQDALRMEKEKLFRSELPGWDLLGRRCRNSDVKWEVFGPDGLHIQTQA